MMSDGERLHRKHCAHPLSEITGGRYECNGCRMDGIGKRYRCNLCDFDLHPDCMFANPKTSITIEGQNCKFMAMPPQKKCKKGNGCKKCKGADCTKGRSCDACGMTIKGFEYHCQQNDWDFHPKCIQLKDTICIEDVIFRLSKEASTKCAYCNSKLLKGAQKNIPGWSYVSDEYDGCNFHVYCVMEMAMQIKSSASAAATTTTFASSKEQNLPFTLHEAVVGTHKVKSVKKGKDGARSYKRDEWLNIINIFLRTLVSILIGDPTTIFATALFRCVEEIFSNLG